MYIQNVTGMPAWLPGGPNWTCILSCTAARGLYQEMTCGPYLRIHYSDNTMPGPELPGSPDPAISSGTTNVPYPSGFSASENPKKDTTQQTKQVPLPCLICWSGRL